MKEQATGNAQDVGGLISLAETYFEAAYRMDAEKFATIFDPRASVTRREDKGGVTVAPISAWLDVVRGMKSPHQTIDTRRDELLLVDVTGDTALLKLRMRLPPRLVTDLLSCFRLDGRWQIVQKVFSAENCPDGGAVSES